MGNYRPLPTKCWEKYLRSIGFNYARTKASHDQWTKKGCFRSITVRGKDKEVPALHLKTSSRTIGVSLETIYDWAEKNC